MRLLVLVVAYQAETTLEKVLDRIPSSVFEDHETEILVIDDASSDATFDLGTAYRTKLPNFPLRVLRNTANQGYGGNQKVGYAYAIEHGFDVVALIHGDGQYAPEELPRLLAPFVAGEAEAVFGSRMMVRGAALKGGMPLYKFVGNKVLTRLQNSMLGTDLSEFHSGYRLYSVRALSGVHFLLNSDGFSFDTEIILQLLNAGARIRELAIPTFYGDEISRVDGIRYAIEILWATAGNAAHRAGILQQRRLDPVRPEDLRRTGTPSANPAVLEAVPPGARVLDIGAADDRVAVALRWRGCRVDVLLRDSAPGDPPRVGSSDPVVDLDGKFDLGLADHEFLLLVDVLSRLHHPERFLDQLRAQLDDRPRKLVLTVGNVAFAAQRTMMALGQFNYAREGILDRTHVRLFTLRSVRHLLRDAGFRVTRVKGLPAPYSKALGDNRVARWLTRANIGLIGVSPTLFSYQYLVEADCTPDMAYRLRDTLSTEAIGEV